MLRHRHVAIMLMLGIFVGEGAASADQADNDDMSTRSKRSFYRYSIGGRNGKQALFNISVFRIRIKNDETFRSVPRAHSDQKKRRRVWSSSPCLYPVSCSFPGSPCPQCGLRGGRSHSHGQYCRNKVKEHGGL